MGDGRTSRGAEKREAPIGDLSGPSGYSGGASLEVRYPEPAIDLASVVACLADAISPSGPAGDAAFLRWDAGAGVLTLDTGAVLARLPSTRFFSQLKPAPGRGFYREASVPRGKGRAHVGGRIVPGTDGRLEAAVGRLRERIEHALDSLEASGFQVETLGAAPAEYALQEIGRQVGCAAQDVLGTCTRVRRTVFAPVAQTQRARSEEIARLLAAIEEIDGDRIDHFERMAAALRELLLDVGHSERDVAVALAYHREQAQTPGSQLCRFFDFLEDEALARIRLQVTFRMMEAIATAAEARPTATGGLALLIRYVRRAATLFAALADPESAPLLINLSARYGIDADFPLQEEALGAQFIGCLPVWPEWVTQIFEQQRRGPGPEATGVREVSYRFRVNGPVPGDGRPTYVVRLERLRSALLGRRTGARRVRRALAELVFLACVVPAREASASDRDGTMAEGRPPLGGAQEVIATLERGGDGAVAALLDDLAARAPVVETISRELIGLLKTVGTAVTASTAARTWEYHVNVLRSLLDPDRAGSSQERPLAVPDAPEREAMAFFRHLRVTRDRPMAGNLFSLRVRVRLSERSLEAAGETVQGQLAKRLPDHWLQVLWRPADARGKQEVAEWLATPRVEVVYDVRKLGLNQAPNETREHLLASFRCAFTVLAYVGLWCVLRRACPSGGANVAGTDDALAVGMLRVQAAGREAPPASGDQAVYAAAHAVEGALARDFHVRMQGMVLRGASGGDDGGVAPGRRSHMRVGSAAYAERLRQQRRGQYGALFSGFPLVVERRGGSGGGALEPAVALIAFGGRPCNDHPEQPGPSATLYTTRTYLATAVDEPFRGYRITCKARHTEVRQGGSEAQGDTLPATVGEEVRRLYETRGCRHVLVLAHRYGARRIGWAAARLRSADLPRQLAELSAGFPDLCLYPLVRDVFPATRMRTRGAHEDAFEILQPDEHLRSAPEEARALRHAYTPVYSLATLHVVGEAWKPQSGFCTYYLLRGGDAGSIEAAERIRANLLLSTSSVRLDLIALLRGVHYFESERPVTPAGTAQPVLDPYAWLQPDSIGEAGEVQVSASRRRAGSVVLSLPAVLERVAGVLHGQLPGAPAPHAR